MLITPVLEHLFRYMFFIYVSVLRKCQECFLISSQDDCFGIVGFESSWITWITVFYQVCFFVAIFFLVCIFSFSLCVYIHIPIYIYTYKHIWGGGIFEFNKVLSIIIFLVHALAFYLKNCCHTQCHVGFLLLYLLNTVLVCVLHSRPIFHFELIFVKDVRSVFRVPFTWCPYWVVISSFFLLALLFAKCFLTM